MWKFPQRRIDTNMKTTTTRTKRGGRRLASKTPKTYKIYALLDDTGNIFYIGRTSQKLSKRLRVHLDMAKRGIRKTRVLLHIRNHGAKNITIKELFCGFMTEIQSASVEASYISQYFNDGVRLTNEHCLRGEPKRRAKPIESKISKYEDEIMKMREDGHTLQSIADKYKCCAETVSRLIGAFE